MNRKGERNMPKVYKDLMISKRNLVDLRYSINRTLYGLNKPNQKHPASIQQQIKKKLCYQCGLLQDPALPHHCKPLFKCPTCFQHCTTKQKLEKHMKQSHHQCQRCHAKHNDDPRVHEIQICGEKRIQCQHCGSKIKRRDIDQHVHKCCFHTCSICKKGIYYKAYSYHVGSCSQFSELKFDTDLNRTKKNGKRQNTNFFNSRSHRDNPYLPCSVFR